MEQILGKKHTMPGAKCCCGQRTHTEMKRTRQYTANKGKQAHLWSEVKKLINIRVVLTDGLSHIIYFEIANIIKGYEILWVLKGDKV